MADENKQLSEIKWRDTQSTAWAKGRKSPAKLKVRLSYSFLKPYKYSKDISVWEGLCQHRSEWSDDTPSSVPLPIFYCTHIREKKPKFLILFPKNVTLFPGWNCTLCKLLTSCMVGCHCEHVNNHFWQKKWGWKESGVLLESAMLQSRDYKCEKLGHRETKR